MRVLSLILRDFRNYREAQVRFGEGLTVVCGRNGAGKTNLLEGLYFGCVGRSCRTANDREVVRHGAGAARVRVISEADDGVHETTVGFVPGQPKRTLIDGAAVDRLLDAAARPLVGVFLPDRLELIAGAPGLRRAHLDQLVAALRPGHAHVRRLYAQALAQRNALIARIRAGHGGRSSLCAWDMRLGELGIALMREREKAAAELEWRCRRLGSALGFDGELSVSYRPRSGAGDAAQLAAELAERLDQDLERGFTVHGPHRDDLLLELGGRELRAYGSRGEQRTALLALLLAEREAITAGRGTAPVMLLDDPMSELDDSRRVALVELLRAGGGQAVIAAVEPEHVPGAQADGVRRVAVENGRVLAEAVAAG